MGKFLDAVKSLEDFRAPWETESGGEVEIDKAALRRYIHNLQVDKAKAQDAREDAAAALKTVTAERDTAKEEAKNASPEQAAAKIAELEKQVTTLTDQLSSTSAKLTLTETRGEVLAGLPAKYAKYVTGTTKEELEASLAEVKADFGLGDDAGDDGENPLVRTPRPIRNPNDPNPGAGSDEIDYEKAAAQILGDSLF